MTMKIDSVEKWDFPRDQDDDPDALIKAVHAESGEYLYTAFLFGPREVRIEHRGRALRFAENLLDAAKEGVPRLKQTFNEQGHFRRGPKPLSNADIRTGRKGGVRRRA